jgi:putative PIN family toxin of toxin-antitoxin system
LTGGFTLVVSPALLAEYTSALGKRRIQKYVPFKRAEREGRIAQLAALADVVDDTQLYHADLRDPDDAIVLAAAAEGRAGYIVTGDEDLLVLRVFETTVIVTPRAFLRHLEA